MPLDFVHLPQTLDPSMESSHSSSSSSSSSSSTPPRCKKPKCTTPCIPDIVAELRHALLVQSSDCLLTHLRCLLSLLQSSVASPAPALCAAGFLELLPPLLSHSCFKVGKKSAEVVGLLAIASYEVSCRLAEKQEVLAQLAQLLETPKFDVLVTAIRSILNVATSDVGCAALREVAGLPQQILRLVSFLADTLTEMIKAEDMETFRTLHKDVGTGRSIKECALSDVNAGLGHRNFLLTLPQEETAECFDLSLAAVNTIFQDFGSVGLITWPDVLVSLRSLWQTIMSQFDGIFLVEFLLAPKRRAQLAKLIVRLAMQDSENVLDNQSTPETVIRHNPLLRQTKSKPGDSKIAGDDSKSSSSFSTAMHHVAMKEGYVDANKFDVRRLFGNVEHFFQKHWELSPAQMTTAFGLSRFMENFAGSGPARMMELLVDAMVACPPAVADELDPWVFYKDMEHELGLLPVLNQDIRLLKSKAGVEIPYPLDTSTVSSRDCIKAYASGNTVVVRGLQFRWPEVAAIANGLAAELGQVTVGANLYLTPPGSQGLGAHFDDHCVFVCQLRGCKRWSVYPPLEPLPRLYSFKNLSTQVKEECATHYNLREGDLLYIPRGFVHKARTVSSEDVEAPTAADNLASCSECCYDKTRTSFTDQNSNASEWHGVSLHLSFGVEIEPAFEWEGLVHIALRLWSLQQQAPGLPRNLDEVCETLLHVAIRSVGSSSQLFRKACILRNTHNPSNNAEDAERMFRFMLNEVRESADCHRAVACYQDIGLDWLRHLPGGHHFNPDLDVVLESSGGVLGSAFQNTRDRFCREASFLESIAAQDTLLCNFRASRLKVMNGLLALHCGCDV